MRNAHLYPLVAGVIIAFAVGLRILLISLHWPPTNSDEATMAFIASDIAYHGKFPIMYYGQDYMGVIEAYLGAFFYHLTGGPSLLALRLGVILLVGLFFIVIYHLTSRIYSKALAIVTLAVLSVGSIPYLTRQTIATGGSTETLLFGSLSFLIATTLAFSYDPQASKRTHLRRLLGYALFGIVVGVGIWSDMAGIPLYGMATLLLLLLCWREIWRWGGLVAGLLGGVIGVIPIIIYFTLIQTKTNPIGVLLAMVIADPTAKKAANPGFWHNLVETIQVSLPTATGYPFCPVIEYPFLGDNTPRMLSCALGQSSWSIGYILLALASLIMALLALKYIRREQKELNPQERRKIVVQQTTRLVMATAAILTILAYAKSAGPNDQPGYHARYIISLIVLTPVIIAPLWHLASQVQWTSIWPQLRSYASRILLLAIVVILISGTGIAFSEVRQTQAAASKQQDLIRNLTRVGATRLYTDYWTCNSLAWASHEKILCIVIDKDRNVNHNRIVSMKAEVDKNDYDASWMCPEDPKLIVADYNCLPSLTAWQDSSSTRGRFSRYKFDGYVVYVLKPQFRK
jgi:4-amino-4-deoxy-L-arabinose transferase-like glycosyltransferase